MKVFKIFILALACISFSVWTTSTLYSLRSQRDMQHISSIVYLPENLIKPLSLEFSGLLSDYLMLKSLVFHGEHLLRKNKLSQEEWQETYQAIRQVTNLDPRFWDPYVMAETSFPWDAGMISETNELLEKAATARPEDYRPYFFIWFNYFYFLDDISSAATYLEKAAVKNNAPNYLVTLAARNNYQVGKTDRGIDFLKSVLKETTDPGRQEWIKTRIKALMTISFLENKVKLFENQFGAKPTHLFELVNKNILKSIPPDPYGGEFYLQKDGTVYTTSKLVPVHH